MKVLIFLCLLLSLNSVDGKERFTVLFSEGGNGSLTVTLVNNSKGGCLVRGFRADLNKVLGLQDTVGPFVGHREWHYLQGGDDAGAGGGGEGETRWFLHFPIWITRK